MSSSTSGDGTVARPDAAIPDHAALDVRFTPGTLVGERYRIVSLLGTGGMGEVYRADDVRLGQRVALKYVPARLANDPAALDRLLHEVRVGRTVSHPNVCRMYDLVEADGHRFIAMEYVDGEDLASLLRRIGRLPAAKAVAIARDVCAGLAAAHEKGVIHRDLKPANIMIDGRGNVRIADFGLAAIGDAESSDGAGTPGYMAPEQLAGGAVTPRSDIYALGVVLYEAFTGERLFHARTRDELRREHAMSKKRPSSSVRDIDPAVERLILRCLEEDPTLRPSSMRAVIAALPGGDPLQVAIDAGETPSPQMVAAAGEAGDLRASQAWLIAAALIASALVNAWLADLITVPGLVSGVRSRDVLADRARSVMRSLGYAPGTDNAAWYFTDVEYLRWIADHDHSASRWQSLRTAPPSPLAMEYRDRQGFLATQSALFPVSDEDPAPIQPGDTSIIVDHEGRLLRFTRVPPPLVPAGTAGDADWHAAFAAAGLDEHRFHPATPEWMPPVASDRQSAWLGSYAEAPWIPVRVEAASLRGRPLFFRVIGPWTVPVAGQRLVKKTIRSLVVLSLLVLATIIARRNAVRDRVDFRGAKRLAVGVGILALLENLFLAHHLSNASLEYEVLIRSVAQVLYYGLFSAMMYCAVEPYVRRRWPRMLVGWSRLVAGRWRDPLVGREVLTGLAAGAATLAITQALSYIALLRGRLIPANPLSDWLSNFAVPAVTVARHGVTAVHWTIGFLTLLLVARLIVRNAAVAIAVVVALYGLMNAGPVGAIDFIAGTITGGVLFLLMFRYGALTSYAARFAMSVFSYAPLTLHWNESFSSIAIQVVLVVLAIAGASFYIALGGKPLFGALVAEEQAAAAQ